MTTTKFIFNLFSSIFSPSKRTMVPVKELSSIGLTKEAKSLETKIKPAITGIRKSLENIEEGIKELINEDQLKHQERLMTSVPGIGLVTAWYVIASTNGMKEFADAKQLACYCGVAPFEHVSGSSIRGRMRVSPMANKTIKWLLHMGTMNIINHKKDDLYDYYQRKVGVGKNKMLVINALRNKLLHRVVAVVKRGSPYEYKKAA